LVVLTCPLFTGIGCFAVKLLNSVTSVVIDVENASFLQLCKQLTDLSTVN